jgi:hypothetical protein
MDLVQEAVRKHQLDPDTAAVALGNLLFAVRMGLDARTWELIRDSLPDVAALLSRASTAAGRTAEIVSLTSPGAIRKSLEASGIPRVAVDGMANSIRSLLTADLPTDAATRAVAALDRALG